MSMRSGVVFASLLCLTLPMFTAAADDRINPVDFQWGQKIPLRDGVKLNATLYRPMDQRAPLPCIFTLTPYISETYHDRGMYFAAHDYVFLTVDVRGRGNSGGGFTPLLQEAKDGYDIVEWLATQPYCNGKVTMWGGSYAGYDQWATAKEFPAHLATIIPVASPRPGVDFPFVQNVYYSYDTQWLTLTSGHTSQENIFDDQAFWSAQFGKWYDAQRPFKELDTIVGNPSPIFQTWLAHPQPDAYWDSYSPSAAQFARIDLPILTITGQYDDDQPGALSFYRDHFRYASAKAKDRHYLVIGPWDHAGTRTPKAEYAGIKFGPTSVIDMNGLNKAWYDWTLKGASKPALLKNKVAYYMLGKGAEDWRYADSLEAITTTLRPMYLNSQGGSDDGVFASGLLAAAAPGGPTKPDHYVYNPLDTTFSAWDPAESSDADLTDQSGLIGATGKILVYHTPAFQQAIELAGFPKLSLWLSLDQPDTDIAVYLYEIKPDGSSIELDSQLLRARYRKSMREPVPAKPRIIERYDFDSMHFIARRIGQGSRLRLAIGPMNSKFFEKNYNSGGVVAEESGQDARTVTVTLYHDGEHPSVLYLPIAANGRDTGH